MINGVQKKTPFVTPYTQFLYIYYIILFIIYLFCGAHFLSLFLYGKR